MDVNNYELQGEIPQSLIDLQNQITEINALLEKREEIEKAVTAHPQLAPSYQEELAANTQALSKKMNELAKTVEPLHTMGSLNTHPDVAHFAKKAEALHTEVNKKAFFAKQNSVGRLLVNPIWYMMSRSKPSKKPLQYDPKAVDELKKEVTTEYWVQDGMFKWHLQDHKCKIKDAEGKEVEEDIHFSGSEFADHYADFVKKHGLTGKNEPECTRNGDKMKIKWPSKERRKEWLEHLEGRYQEKRRKEMGIDKPKHEAQVDVNRQRNNDDAIHATTPAA